MRICYLPFENLWNSSDRYDESDEEPSYRKNYAVSNCKIPARKISLGKSDFMLVAQSAGGCPSSRRHGRRDPTGARGSRRTGEGAGRHGAPAGGAARGARDEIHF